VSILWCGTQASDGLRTRIFLFLHLAQALLDRRFREGAEAVEVVAIRWKDHVALFASRHQPASSGRKRPFEHGERTEREESRLNKQGWNVKRQINTQGSLVA
jgi:hypothetical protein